MITKLGLTLAIGAVSAVLLAPPGSGRAHAQVTVPAAAEGQVYADGATEAPSRATVDIIFDASVTQRYSAYAGIFSLSGTGLAPDEIASATVRLPLSGLGQGAATIGWASYAPQDGAIDEDDAALFAGAPALATLSTSGTLPELVLDVTEPVRQALGGPFAIFISRQDGAPADLRTDPVYTIAKGSASHTIFANLPPVARCIEPEGGHLRVPLGPDGRATLRAEDLDGGSSDPEGGPLTLCVSPSELDVSHLGTEQEITLTVTDDHGQTDTCDVHVLATDETPPTIRSISVSPGTLWPPNHRMVPVTVSIALSDNCDPEPRATIVLATSGEPEDGTAGGGGAEPDIEITGDLTLSLRAEREGGGAGRVYTIDVVCADAYGNTVTRTLTVTVPHDQGKGKGKGK